MPSRRPTGRPATWCSDRCKRAAYEERRAAANGAVAVKIVEKVVEKDTRVINECARNARSDQMETKSATRSFGHANSRPGQRAWPARRRHARRQPLRKWPSGTIGALDCPDTIRPGLRVGPHRAIASPVGAEPTRAEQLLASVDDLERCGQLVGINPDSDVLHVLLPPERVGSPKRERPAGHLGRCLARHRPCGNPLVAQIDAPRPGPVSGDVIGRSIGTRRLSHAPDKHAFAKGFSHGTCPLVYSCAVLAWSKAMQPAATMSTAAALRALAGPYRVVRVAARGSPTRLAATTVIRWVV